MSGVGAVRFSDKASTESGAALVNELRSLRQRDLHAFRDRISTIQRKIYDSYHGFVSDEFQHAYYFLESDGPASALTHDRCAPDEAVSYADLAHYLIELETEDGDCPHVPNLFLCMAYKWPSLFEWLLFAFAAPGLLSKEMRAVIQTTLIIGRVCRESALRVLLQRHNFRFAFKESELTEAIGRRYSPVGKSSYILSQISAGLVDIAKRDWLCNEWQWVVCDNLDSLYLQLFFCVSDWKA
jgi:hypothetical protein